MRLVRGGDDDVLPGAQAEALRHLAQVDVGLAASFGGAVEEEVLLHVLLVAVHLRRGQRWELSGVWRSRCLFLSVLGGSSPPSEPAETGGAASAV